VRTVAAMLPGSAVLVLTNDGVSALCQALLSAGASRCFDKTLEHESLRLTLESMVAAMHRAHGSSSTSNR
jgi:hypothetical protein